MTQKKVKPLFITFEGGEGAGKSTQSSLLHKAFIDKGITAICTREPGGTKNAEIIRDLLVSGPVNRWQPKTELLLHFATRIEHIELFIKPHLQKEYMVICDRFIDSTIAYQGYGHGLDQELIKQIYEMLVGKFYPDITIFLNVAIDDSTKRISSINDNSRPDRYENMGEGFHKRVLEGFKSLAKSTPERYIVIDGNRSIVEVHQEIIKSLNSKFSLKLLPNSL